MDLISPDVVNHHKRVAYIALNIAAEMRLSTEEQTNLLLAGLLHDSGAFSLKDRIDDLLFEFEFESKDPHKHAYLGYALLKRFEFLSNVALLVRYHHVFWNKRSGSKLEGQVPMGSHILHLADRVDILINRQKEVLGQVKGICERVEGYSGRMFAPHLVEVFRSLASKEYFWLDTVSSSISSIFARKLGITTIELDLEGLLSLAKLFCQIIDFQEPIHCHSLKRGGSQCRSTGQIDWLLRKRMPDDEDCRLPSRFGQARCTFRDFRETSEINRGRIQHHQKPSILHLPYP